MFKIGYLLFILGAMLTGIFVSGSSAEPVDEAPLQMSIKENHYGTLKKMTKSSAQISETSYETLPALPVDASLEKKLKTISTSSPEVKNKQDCLAQANELDKRRTVVQERGGLWHIFESVKEIKEYTNYGMQLDSQMNRLVLSLKHLCGATKGMQLNGWGREKVEELQKWGKEKMREKYLAFGDAEDDIKIWIKYAEIAIESKKRNIPFSQVRESISRSENMVAMYEELSLRKINKGNKKSFYLEASTLLSAIKDSFQSDPNIGLAIEEENLLSHTDLEADSA
jgi:soluble cytochrome b562